MVPSADADDLSDVLAQLPAPPRRVRGRFGVYRTAIFLFYLLALIWAGGYLLLLILTAAFGVNVDASIINTRVSHSAKGGDNHYVDFAYTVSGVQYDGEAGVSDDMYDGYNAVLHGRDRNARSIMIRYFAIGPFRHIDFLPESSLFSDMFIPTLVIAVLLVLRGMFYIRYRLLFKYGLATGGVIQHKYVRRSRSSTYYYLVYRYANPNTGKEIERKCDCGSEKQYETVHVGQAVTVLYSRSYPSNSTLYDFGLYVVVK